MHYFIYKTTNKLNGKFYIGQHITNDMEDGYIGSGTCLRRAIKKHGKENFVRQILCYADDENDLNELEELAVTWKEVSDPNCYNLMTGGGSCGKHGKETRQKMSAAKKGKKYSMAHRKKISDANKGKKLSIETRQKISDATNGENNPGFRPLSQEAKDILLSMPDFKTATLNALHQRLYKKHKTTAGITAISLFKQDQ